MPYVGWSAGCNVATPSIRTTNDMPVCSAAVLPALGLFPLQINPHYLDASISGHMGRPATSAWPSSAPSTRANTW